MTFSRWASAAMALLFSSAAVVQWNDPDPLPWIVAYCATAYLAARRALGRINGKQPLANGCIH